MRFLTHPALIPIYAYAFIIELERQSYYINLKLVLIIMAYAAAIFIGSSYIVNEKCRKNLLESKPLINPKADTRPRIHIAILFTLGIACLTFIAIRLGYLFTWGAKYAFAIFIVPVWLNILSGESLKKIIPSLGNTFMAKANLAPLAFIGSLTALVIGIGYRTSIDTFWPFVISLMLATIESYHQIRETEQPFSTQLYSYLTGIIQGIITMFTFA